MSASATLVGDFTVGAGNSWDVSWSDTSGGTQINGLEAVIVSGNATFDSAMSVTLAGWSGTLLNSTLSYASGTANGADRTISLSFTDPAPAGGVVVDIFELYNGVVVGSPLQAWQWENLPADQSWQFISSNDLVPVPEATTMIAGALLLLPFGVSTFRILRRNRIG